MSHTNDVTAIAVHNDGVRVASGELGPKPAIYVWDSNTMMIVCKFVGVLSKGIAALSFSPSGDRFAAVSIDTDHAIAVFDITSKSKSGGVKLFCEKGGPDVILGLAWKNEQVSSHFLFNHVSFLFSIYFFTIILLSE
jgi:microtubule-associated protein-like 6